MRPALVLALSALAASASAQAGRFRVEETSIAAIQKDNRIRNSKRLRPGQVLVIRPGRHYKGE